MADVVADPQVLPGFWPTASLVGCLPELLKEGNRFGRGFKQAEGLRLNCQPDRPTGLLLQLAEVTGQAEQLSDGLFEKVGRPFSLLEAEWQGRDAAVGPGRQDAG